MLEKLKFLKNNQIIMIVIALILIFMGYLNFSSVNNDTDKKDEIEYAGIGDAKLVSSSNVEENSFIDEEIGDAISTSTENVDENNIEVNNINNKTNETSVNISKDDDEYFESSRLNRQTMYSQMLETYQRILENEQITQDQKAIAQTEIKNINDIKNKIMICENLIKLKDIKDVVIFVNDPSISVVVKGDKLKEDQIAQIQNIITREMKAEVDNIHISTR